MPTHPRWNRIAFAMVAMLLARATPSLAVSPADLPPSLRALPMDALLGAFSIPFEPPSLAAEVATLRAWVPPGEDVNACPALAQVIVRYPGTAAARRALLDIAGVYGRMDDWKTAEAPFRYVMEAFPDSPQARIAHLRLVEAYRYGDPSGRAPALDECYSAKEACLGTPEEGAACMLLGDLLAEQRAYVEAFSQYQRVMAEFPGQVYTNYARIRYALALTESGAPDRALEVLAPVLEDPVWGGRAYYARGAAQLKLGLVDAAVSDYEKASKTADSLWFRSESHRRLAGIFTERGHGGRATDHLRQCLAAYPLRKDDLDIRLEIVQNLDASGDHLGAAQEALALELDALNSPQRYLPQAVRMVTTACDKILDKCEAALASPQSKPGAPSTTGGAAVAGPRQGDEVTTRGAARLPGALWPLVHQ